MLDRRGFLKFIGGAAVGTLATPVVWKGLDDISIWSQNWPWIPSLQYGNHENNARGTRCTIPDIFRFVKHRF